MQVMIKFLNIFINQFENFIVILKAHTESLFVKYFPRLDIQSIASSDPGPYTSSKVDTTFGRSQPVEYKDNNKNKISVKDLVKSSVNKTKQADVTTPLMNLETSSLQSVDLSLPITSDNSDGLNRSNKSHSLAELDMLISTLSAEETNGPIAIVSAKLFSESQRNLKGKNFPFTIVPTHYVIHNIGDIASMKISYEQSDFLFPYNYCCSKRVNIHLISDNVSNGSNPYVTVDLFSRIVPPRQLDVESMPEFRITFPNGTVVSTGANPKEAWDKIIGKNNIFLYSFIYSKELLLKL